jgi:hypothetical protein
MPFSRPYTSPYYLCSMIRKLGIATLALVVLLPGCIPEEVPDYEGRYTYNVHNGRCENISGEVGFNEFDVDFIRKTKDCECVKLSKIEILDLAGDTIAIPQRLAYYKLTGYNFKGSVLDSCELFFNYIVRSDLRGADLSTLQYGYAFVTGRVDDFTKVPVEGQVTFHDDSVTCYR